MAIPGLDPNRPRNWLPGIGKVEAKPVDRLALIKARQVARAAETAAPVRGEDDHEDEEESWDESEIPTNGPVTVSTLGVKDSSEPRDGSVPRKNADQPQTRTTTFRPSKRSRSSAPRNDRAPASLGTESPVVEVPRGALYDGGAAPEIRPRITHAGGAKPDTLVDAAPERLTDAGSTPARSTEEENAMDEKWITTTEAAERLGVKRQKINNWVTWKQVKFKREGRRLLVSVASVDAKAADGGLKPPAPARRAKAKRSPADTTGVTLNVDGEKIADLIKQLAPQPTPEALAMPSPFGALPTLAESARRSEDAWKVECTGIEGTLQPLDEKPRPELVRQLRALLEMHEVIPTFNIYELLRHVRAVVA
jgi:excisionase family DNA binding protein